MNSIKVIRNLSLAVLLTMGSGLSLAHDDKAAMPSSGSGELHAAMMKGMQDPKSMKMTGDVDKDFAMMMIMHHEQAIAMAKVLQDKGRNPELKAMAQKMSAQQQNEIQDLKRFQ